MEDSVSSAAPAWGSLTNVQAWSLCCVGVVVFVLSASTVDAQEAKANPPDQVSVGMSLPLAFNDHPTCCDTPYRALDLTVGVWGEFVKSPSPSVAFHTGVEFPKPYSANVKVESSAGFVSTLRHRDIVAYELMGFHSRSRSRVQPIGLVGFGIVFSHTVDHRQDELCCTGPPLGPVMVSSRSQIDAAVLGGLDISVRLNARAEMVIRTQGRITLRSIDTNVFRWFSLVPGVALSFHSGR